MKLYSLVLCLLLSITSFSQSPLFTYWDFQLDTVSISQFSIDSTNQNNFIWQIGQSHKPFFGNTNILVTDTIQMYNGPIDASVNMLLTRSQSNSWGSNVVQFDHKMDTDTNNAGGYFEINIDNDSLKYVNSNNDTLSTYWMRLFLNNEVDTTEMFGFSPYSYNAFYGMDPYLLTQNNDLITLNDVIETNFDDLYHHLLSSYYLSYGYTDTLHNNTTGFTGEFDDYKTFYLEFMFFDAIGLKSQDYNDSLNFRFHFVSDGSSSTKNGWAIRNIKTGYSVHPSGGITENKLNSEIATFPNPTHSKFNFKINSNKNEELIIEIYNAIGKKIDSFQKASSDTVIDLTNYAKGIYYINYVSKNEIIGHSKVVKL